MKADLQRWWVHYNFSRRHRRIGRITPYEAVCRWYAKQPELFLKRACPPALLPFANWWDLTSGGYVAEEEMGCEKRHQIASAASFEADRRSGGESSEDGQGRSLLYVGILT
jgi:hypothetical protein